jgi:hypothetical protein
VYAFARSVEGRFSEGDFNLTLLYNTSTFYDDLAWAAGWLYKATKQVGAAPSHPLWHSTWSLLHLCSCQAALGGASS